MNSKGVTLIELIVVAAIIAILAVALGFTYVGWQGAYRVEKTTKDLYTDLMDARTRAITQGRAYFADFNTPAPPAGQGSYRVIEDTNGNLVSNPGAGLPNDTTLQTFPKTIEYVITWNGGGDIGIDRRGTISNVILGVWAPITTVPPFPIIQVVSTVTPDYDCIIVEAMRLNLGQWDGANCNAK